MLNKLYLLNKINSRWLFKGISIEDFIEIELSEYYLMHLGEIGFLKALRLQKQCRDFLSNN